MHILTGLSSTVLCIFIPPLCISHMFFLSRGLSPILLSPLVCAESVKMDVKNVEQWMSKIKETYPQNQGMQLGFDVENEGEGRLLDTEARRLPEQ